MMHLSKGRRIIQMLGVSTLHARGSVAHEDTKGSGFLTSLQHCTSKNDFMQSGGSWLLLFWKMKLKITNLYGSIAVPASASRLDLDIAIRSSALLPSPSSRCDSPKKNLTPFLSPIPFLYTFILTSPSLFFYSVSSLF
ncbi:hypothetical protein VNO77_38967 [Canavalia gladiata]|uniref:Uncharacterized protein n=1 Tax=Canavalia gladiata TaxID=3824 RepID=A0AAN9KBD3_CANGL